MCACICLTDNLVSGVLRLWSWAHFIWSYVWILLQVPLLSFFLGCEDFWKFLLFRFYLSHLAHLWILQLQNQIFTFSASWLRSQLLVISVDSWLLQKGFKLLLARCKVSLFRAIALLTSTTFILVTLLRIHVCRWCLRTQLSLSYHLTLCFGYTLRTAFLIPKMSLVQKLVNL